MLLEHLVSFSQPGARKENFQVRTQMRGPMYAHLGNECAPKGDPAPEVSGAAKEGRCWGKGHGSWGSGREPRQPWKWNRTQLVDGKLGMARPPGFLAKGCTTGLALHIIWSHQWQEKVKHLTWNLCVTSENQLLSLLWRHLASLPLSWDQWSVLTGTFLKWLYWGVIAHLDIHLS